MNTYVFGTMMRLLYENISKMQNQGRHVQPPETRNIENHNVSFFRSPVFYGAVLAVMNASGMLQDGNALFRSKTTKCAQSGKQ